MIMKSVKIVARAEVKDLLRSKQVLIIMIILPLLIYSLLTTGIMLCSQRNISEIGEIRVGVQSEDSFKIDSILENIKSEYEFISIVPNNYMQDLQEGKIAAYIHLYENQGTEIYKVYADRECVEVQIVIDSLEEVINTYKKDASINVDYQFNQVDTQVEYNPFLKIETPLLLIVMIFITIGGVISSIYMARKVKIDDKNRKQVEALLSMPIESKELVAGKYLTVVYMMSIKLIMSIITSVLIILIASVINKELVSNSLSILINRNNTSIENVTMVIMMVISNFIYIAALGAINMHMFATPKSRSNPRKVVMFIGASLLVLMICILQIGMQNIRTTFDEYITIAIVFMLVIFCIGGIYKYLTIVHMSKERVLFAVPSKESNRNIHNRKLPSAMQAMLIFYISFLVANILYFIPSTYQVFCIIIPILAVLYLKYDIKETFSLHMPKIQHVFGGVCVWIGMYVANTIITNIMLCIFPTDTQLQANVIQMMHSTDNILLILISVAVMPGIGEEMLFRGFMLSGLRSGDNGQKVDKKRGLRAVLVTSIIFGIIHTELRVIPSIIVMGLGFGYIVYKSNSIYIAMLLHTFNNAYATLLEIKPEWTGTKIITQILDAFLQPQISSVLLLIGVIVLGVVLMNIPSNRNTIESKDIKL